MAHIVIEVFFAAVLLFACWGIYDTFKNAK
jgi:hypothetical protein